MTGKPYDPSSEGAQMSFEGRMSYSDYLHLERVLDAQEPLSDAHDELLFIIQHQTSELWMKLIIHELDAVLGFLAADDLGPAQKGLEFGIPVEIVTAHRRTHESHVAAIRKAYDSGATIIAGSDSGLTNFPQGGGLEEVCAYVEVIGMSEEEPLLTATRNAARVIGFDEAGTLEPGKFADLLVFVENPLERIRVLTEPEALEAVVQGGVVVAGELPLGAVQLAG